MRSVARAARAGRCVSAGGRPDVKTLIVEDSATLCDIYARYLDGRGLDVSSLQTLGAAQQRLTDSAPQLILLDIELPDGNGLDLLEDVKRLSS